MSATTADRSRSLPLASISAGRSLPGAPTRVSFTNDSSDKTAGGKIAHERTDTEIPGRCRIASHHGVDERSQLHGRDPYDIAHFVGESTTRLVAILNRGEQGAQEQHEAVRVLVAAIHGLRNQ